jgi:hypothetical protein
MHKRASSTLNAIFATEKPFFLPVGSELRDIRASKLTENLN